ncbi:MAG: hypothetical protein AcusKO_28290 [Acuticoccus sp.]
METLKIRPKPRSVTTREEADLYSGFETPCSKTCVDTGAGGMAPADARQNRGLAFRHEYRNAA